MRAFVIRSRTLRFPVWPLAFRSVTNVFFNPQSVEIRPYKSWRTKFFFNLKLSLMSYSALSDSFEYLCYGSIFTIAVRGSTVDVSI